MEARELKKVINPRKQWFLERIGQRVYRNNTSCNCSSCTHSYQEGVVISDEQHAIYLYDLECGYAADGDVLTYFDTYEEVKILEQRIIDGSYIKFGRWLLKNAVATDAGEGLHWMYDGRAYNTDELYLEYKTLENLMKQEDVVYEVINPATPEELAIRHFLDTGNAVHVSRMSVDEIIEKYGDFMTAEEIEKLKNYKPTS